MQNLTAIVRAAQTLTLSGNAVANETVVVGGVTYTWKASVTTTANEVKVGADASASLDNLKAAINADAAGSGSTYGSLTVVNPHVKATTKTATTLKVVSRVPGAIGNLIASTETMTNGAWGAATLASGSGSIATALSEILSAAQLKADLYNVLNNYDDDSQ